MIISESLGRRPSRGAVRIKLPSQEAPSAGTGKACDILVAQAPTLEWVCRPAHIAHGLSRGGRRRGERVRQGGQGTQSRAPALDGPGALLTTRWAAYRRGFDSRWQPREVHARKHTGGCPARNLFRRSALSLESLQCLNLIELACAYANLKIQVCAVGMPGVIRMPPGRCGATLAYHSMKNSSSLRALHSVIAEFILCGPHTSLSLSGDGLAVAMQPFVLWAHPQVALVYNR